jgi:Na+-driven multidrug efflux pump
VSVVSANEIIDLIKVSFLSRYSLGDLSLHFILLNSFGILINIPDGFSCNVCTYVGFWIGRGNVSQTK